MATAARDFGPAAAVTFVEVSRCRPGGCRRARPDTGLVGIATRDGRNWPTIHVRARPHVIRCGFALGSFDIGDAKIRPIGKLGQNRAIEFATGSIAAIVGAMHITLRSAIALAAAVPFGLAAPALASGTAPGVATARDAALTDRTALDFVADLTTEIGPRPAGTEAEARARVWAVARLRAMGFANVHVDTYRMPVWLRGEERAEIIAPYPARLAITALGASAATPADGITGDIAGFRSLADFDAAPDAAIRGKVVYIGNAMLATQDGSGYRAFGPARFVGPDRAARRGAAAIIIRSIGTDHHRNPHTGLTNFSAGTSPIPAGAISNPDADNLERMMDRATTPIRIHLVLTPRRLDDQPSGSVAGDIVGSDPAAGIVLAACHLDSWDLATGAIDNAAGCGIIAAAAKRAGAAGRPRRTIRVLFAGAEEVGGFGGRAYAAAHTADRHVATLESDFGADRVWRVQTRLPASAAPLADRIAAALAPLGIVRGTGEAHGGSDDEPLVEAGVPVVDLDQDGTRYFDLHHTPDDTFDKIRPDAIAQNVAAWTATLILLANAPEPLAVQPRPAPATAH